MLREWPLRHRFRFSAAVTTVLFYLAGAAILLVRICSSTHMHFTYTLDDPYIHLALAERVRHGLYGLNAGEAVSPSSSILWPFLLAPFAGTWIFDMVPLLINLVCGTVAAYLLGSLLDRYYPPDNSTPEQRRMTFLLGILLVLATNCLGLTFTGLEQLLELTLCIACSVLVVLAVERERKPFWMIAAAAVLPLVRYEGLLVMLAIVAVLWVADRRRAAIGVLIVGTAPMACFSLFLKHLGLPALPISVLVKGSAAVEGIGGSKVDHIVSLLKAGARGAVHDPERGAVLIPTLAAWGLLIHLRHNRRSALLLAPVAIVSTVQLVFGPFGWDYRYEMYAIGFVLPILVASQAGLWTFAPDDAAPRIPLDADFRPRLGLLAVAVGALAWVYWSGYSLAGNAAQSIYRGDSQIGRLTHDFYKGPVAVNDLGLVSDHRDPNQYVLDFGSLGSVEDFRTPKAQKTQQWYLQTAHRHHVGLVAVFPEWFVGRLPVQWQPVGKLCAKNVMIGPYSARTMLYATPDADLPTLMKTLQDFRATLPPGTVLDMMPKDSTNICQ